MKWRSRVLGISAAFLAVLGGAPATWASAQNHVGDLVVTWGNTVVIEDTDYTQKGDIYVEDGGKLIIRNAALTMLCDYDGQYAFRVRGGELEMANVRLASSGTRVDVWVSGNGHARLSSVTGSAINPWLSGNASGSFVDSQLGCIDISEGATVEMRSSVVQFFIRLGVESPAPITFAGLAPGRYEDTQIPSAAAPGAFSLSLKDTYVSGWVARVGLGARVTIRDSELDQVDMRFLDATGTIGGLQLGLQHDWNSSALAVRGRTSQVCLVDTTVTRGWFMLIAGSSRLKILDSVVSLSLREDSSVELERCRVNWFEEFNHYGAVTFSGTTLGDYMQVVDTAARWEGDVRILGGTLLAGWYSSSIARTYQVQVTDARGGPMPQARYQVVDATGGVVLQGIADSQGQARVMLTFTSEDYRDTWTLTVVGYPQTQAIGFLTSTPVTLAVSH